MGHGIWGGGDKSLRGGPMAIDGEAVDEWGTGSEVGAVTAWEVEPTHRP